MPKIPTLDDLDFSKLPKFELPEFDLSKFELPKFDLPKFDLPGLEDVDLPSPSSWRRSPVTPPTSASVWPS